MKLPIGFSLLKDPYPFQKKAILCGIVNNQIGIILNTGRGKSYIAINIARYRIQFKQVDKILVITPPTLMENWLGEIKRFSEYGGIVMHDSIRQNRMELISAFKQVPELKFGIINYEGLDPYLEYLSDLDYQMVIADESSRYMKSNVSNRTKAAIALSKVPYKLILTATLLGNQPLDLWPQYMFLDNGRSFGENFYSFRYKMFNEYTLGKRKKFKKWVLKKEFIPFIQMTIDKTCVSISKEEANLGMPEQVWQVIEIEYDTKQLETYKGIESQIIKEIETESGIKSTATFNIFNKLLRLQEITSGFMTQMSYTTVQEVFGKTRVEKSKDKEGNTIYANRTRLKETPKLDAALELIDDIVSGKESVIVFCRFKMSIDMLSHDLTKMGIKNITMTGEDKDKHSLWTGFQKSKNTNVFIAQIRSGGIGINLNKKGSTEDTQHTLFYENTFEPDDRKQAEGRSWRLDQTALHCRYIDLLLKHTVDKYIYRMRNEKQNLISLIMRDGAQSILTREE